MKNFSDWQKIKPAIHEKNNDDLYFYEKEIWFASCGCNIGHEQDGKNELFSRPVLVFKKFSKRLFWGIPLTKKIRDGKYYFNFTYKNELESSAILTQMKLFDKNRLIRKDGHIEKTDFQGLIKKIRKLF